MTTIIVGIVTFILGGAGGFFAGWSAHPSDSATKNLTAVEIVQTASQYGACVYRETVCSAGRSGTEGRSSETRCEQISNQCTTMERIEYCLGVSGQDKLKFISQPELGKRFEQHFKDLTERKIKALPQDLKLNDNETKKLAKFLLGFDTLSDSEILYVALRSDINIIDILHVPSKTGLSYENCLQTFQLRK